MLDYIELFQPRTISGAILIPRVAKHIWTVAEAKSRLSEVLRRAQYEGPQCIGTRNRFVVLPEAEFERLAARSHPLGAWLVENLPRAACAAEELPPPDRRDPPRTSPFETPPFEPEAS